MPKLYSPRMSADVVSFRPAGAIPSGQLGVRATPEVGFLGQSNPAGSIQYDAIILVGVDEGQMSDLFKDGERVQPANAVEKLLDERHGDGV